MNTKRSIIYFLLLITVLVGILTIYLASKLKNVPETVIKISPTVTPVSVTSQPELSVTIRATSSVSTTPTKAVTNAPTTSVTSPAGSPVISQVNIACGSSCDKGSCISGNVCAKINNVNKCVLSACVTGQNGQYTANGNCEQDLCTVKNSIQIQKTSAISCNNDLNTRKIKFVIKIVNPVGITIQRTNLVVTDQFNVNFKDSYVIAGSISDGGSLSNGKITWQNLTLSANGGSKELIYEAAVPITDKDKDYSNSVVVSESSTPKGSFQYSSTLNVLPCTALITDEIDRIIIGLCVLIFGIYIFKNNLHYELGKKYWKFGGMAIDHHLRELFFKIKFEEKGNYERHLIEKDDRNKDQ